MGFGTYDEEEQENQEDDAELEEEDAVSVHDKDHDGDVAVEGADDQDELLDRLEDMKD